MRNTVIPLLYRDRALTVIRSALAVMAGRRYLVDAPTDRAAKQQVHGRMCRAGLRRQGLGSRVAPRLLSRRLQYYLGEGYIAKEALALCSRDLGHGKGRGRWVFNNYLRATYEQQV